MYNVQTKTQSKAARMGFIVLVIASVFVACFMATQALLTAVYGFDFKTNKAYQDVMSATTNATDITEGYAINSYVQYVKGEICPTLKNITAEAECMNI